jgi:twitching motility protein PilT
VVSEETALTYGSDKSRLMQMIDRIKSERGDKVTDIGDLHIDLDYGKS